MKEISANGTSPEGTPSRATCSCGNGGATDGTSQAGTHHGSRCSCSCGETETTDSVLTGAMDR